MNTYFFTGFPGFIATQLIKRIAKEYPDSHFKLLVLPSQTEKAQSEVKQLLESEQLDEGQFSILTGDITKSQLGLDSETNQTLIEQINYVFHLAAIYDLAVAKDIAYEVNVNGTKNVIEWVLQLKQLKRFAYFSTAYVSGYRVGKIYETDLDHGQSFKNHYESTKFEAEVLVQNVRDRVPTTIIRPGIVMGHSLTGATVKFDGPYFVMRFLDKFAKFPIPYVGKGEAYINLVPVDYIMHATCYLAHQSVGCNKVYHLTTPTPYTSRDTYRLICEALINKTPSYTLPSSLVTRMLAIPAFRKWVKVEQETVEYFDHKAEYDSTQAQQDLKESGIACPDFASYIRLAVEFYKKHRNDPDKLIIVH